MSALDEVRRPFVDLTLDLGRCALRLVSHKRYEALRLVDPERGGPPDVELAPRAARRLAALLSAYADARDPGATPARTKVVVLCGSTRFKVALREWEARLEMEERCAVLGVTLWSDGPVIEPTSEERAIADRAHETKMLLADEVFVVDPGGYVGEGTAREMATAAARGLPVRRLSAEHPGWAEADCRYWRRAPPTA